MEDEPVRQGSWNTALPPKFGVGRSGGMSSSSLTKGSLSASNGAPLPNLNGDLRQAVFTHRSVRRPTPNENWGDNTRLAVLGEEIMRLVVTWCLFEKRPMISAQEISSAREEFLSSANIDAWANAYRMKQDLLISVDMVPSLQMPEESRTLFASFVGAVYYQHGLVECNKWIGSLLDPNVEPPAPPGVPAQPIKIEQSIWPNPAAIQTYPPQPTATPPPVPASDAGTSTMETGSEPSLGGPLPIPPPYSNPASTAIPGPTFLPLVNQTANQRRMTIDYPSQFAGPAHAGQWQVRCTINGVAKGEGVAASKQLAKEEAARQAYFAMGWDARPGSVNYSRSTSEYRSPPPASQHSGEDFDMGAPPSHTATSSHSQTPPSQSYTRTTGPQSYPGNYPATAPPATAYLPLFNQTATQRRLAIDYPSEFSGPAHAGRWTVKCTVNGIVKGTGQGMSKQLAKEEAAKSAWFAMGWGSRT